MPKLKFLHLCLGFLVFVLNIGVVNGQDCTPKTKVKNVNLHKEGNPFGSISAQNFASTKTKKDTASGFIKPLPTTRRYLIASTKPPNISTPNFDSLLAGVMGCGIVNGYASFNNCFSKSISVVNQKNQALANHILTTNIGLISLDSMGRMDAFVLKTKNFDSLLISCLGYEKKKIATKDLDNITTIILKEKAEELQEVTIVGQNFRRRFCCYCTGTLSKNQNEVETKNDSTLIQTKKEVEKFNIHNSSLNINIYPNPAKANQTINLKISDQGNYVVQFISSNGQIIFQKNINTNVKNQQMSINAPSINASQMVMLQLINMQTKFKHTQSMFLIP